jgi:drug/metabolite transporter (DMT)-like permease
MGTRSSQLARLAANHSGSGISRLSRVTISGLTSRLRPVAGPLCAALSALGFAGKAVLIKVLYARAAMDAVTLVALRMLFSLPLFLALAWWGQRRTPQTPMARRDWQQLVWLGFLGYYFSSFLDFSGLQYISAALERILLFTYPAMVLLLSAWFLRKPVTGREVASLGLTGAGIVLAFVNDVRLSGAADAVWKGSGLVLAAAFTYAVYLIRSGQMIARVGSMRFAAAAFTFASAFALAQFVATRPLERLMHTASTYGLVALLAVASTVLPIFLLTEAIRLMDAKRVGLIGSVGPILTLGLGAVFLGEPMTGLQVAGAALVLGGVVLVSQPQAGSVE